MKKLSLILLSLSLLNATSLKTMLESIENNEQLKAKNYETLSKEESAKSVKYKYYPSATLQVGFVSFDYDRYIINPNNLTNVSLAIDALIYDGKRNSNINLAKKNHELSQIELEKAKNELEFNLASLYYSYLALIENIEYKEQNLKYLNASLSRLENLNKVGLRPNDELEIFRAKVELNKSELNNLNYQKDEILSNIYLITNNNFIPTKGSAIIYEDSVNKSYDIKINSLKEEMSELNKDLSLAPFKPTIFVKNVVGFSKNNFNYSLYVPFDMIVKERVKEKMFSNIFMLGLSWNVFSFGADKKAYESAKLSNLAAKEMNIYSKKSVSEKEKLLIQKISFLQEEINANEKLLNASKIAYESIAKKYEAGLVGYVEYLNSLETMQGALAKLSLSKAKFEITKAELLLAKGIIIKDFVIDL